MIHFLHWSKLKTVAEWEKKMRIKLVFIFAEIMRSEATMNMQSYETYIKDKSFCWLYSALYQPFTIRSQRLTTLRENIVGKEENALSLMCFFLPKTDVNFSLKFMWSSSNALIKDSSKILSF